MIMQLGRFSLVINAIFFFFGCLLNVVSYRSIDPVALSLVFFSLGLVLVRMSTQSYALIRHIYFRVFSVNWFMAGVSSIYKVFYDDPIQNDSDPSTFFELASGGAVGLRLEDLKFLTEGSGAVLIWRSIYDFFSYFGFSPEVYIGLLVNVLAVSLTAVIAMMTMILIYGPDPRRASLLTILFASCGLFWLFSAIHMRDAVILLGVSTLNYFWTRYLTKMTLVNMLRLILFNIFAFFFFVYLREEFLFVPIATGFAGILSMLLFQRGGLSRTGIVLLISIFGAVFIAGIFILNVDVFMTKMAGGSESYQELSTESASDGSLGILLIMGQPLPIRLILGAAYLFVFPIPFWSGFLSDSAYLIFKSCNAIFFYFTIPLFFLSIIHIVKNSSCRKVVVMFQLILIIGFTLAVAGTSTESRHFGVFLVPLFMVCLLPDFNIRRNIVNYSFLLELFLGIMFFVNLACFVIKS